MSEVETQENQKTVVAFITGLLIGGLLVWVFSSTPEAKVQETSNEDEQTEVTQDTEKENTQIANDTTTKEVVGEGSIKVADQKAGKLVLLGETKLPTKNGWIVVKDYMDSVPGNILGAARYSTSEGLMPKSVELIRETVAGSSYQVVFYASNGDTAFKIGEDTIIDGMSTTFKAN